MKIHKAAFYMPGLPPYTYRGFLCRRGTGGVPLEATVENSKKRWAKVTCAHCLKYKREETHAI